MLLYILEIFSFVSFHHLLSIIIHTLDIDRDYVWREPARCTLPLCLFFPFFFSLVGRGAGSVFLSSGLWTRMGLVGIAFFFNVARKIVVIGVKYFRGEQSCVLSTRNSLSM